MDKQKKIKLIVSVVGLVIVVVFAAFYFPDLKMNRQRNLSILKAEKINYDSMFVTLLRDTNSNIRILIDSLVEQRIENFKPQITIVNNKPKKQK